jgi:spermidine synthase
VSPGASPPSLVPLRLLRAVACVAGACVMAVEMAASRLLAPAFGTSLPVWACLIGVVLLAMALGANAGGRLADRRPGRAGLAWSLAGAGALVGLLPLVGRGALAVLSAGIVMTPPALVLAAFAATLLLIAPPVFVLGFISPYAIRLGTADVASAGRVAGSLGAWSTAGGLLGTFLSALWAIPTFGTRATLLAIAAVLIITGAGVLRGVPPVALLLVPAVAALLSAGPLRRTPGLLFARESPYQYVEVVHGDGLTQLVVNEGGAVQSVWRDGSPLTGLYYDAYLLLPFLQRGEGADRSLLVVGAGGGTILRQYHDVLGHRFRLDLSGVEIDPVVAATGPRFFGLPPDLAASVHIADARVFLAHDPRRYDLIVVDAYANQLYIPFQLTTVEFFRLAAAHLRPGGLLAMNVNAVDTASPLLAAILHTLHAVFPATYLARAPGAFNYLLVGAATPVDVTALASLAVPAPLRSVAAAVAASWRADAGPGGMLLTDDRAPVEFLADWEIWRGIQRYGP